MPQRRLQLGLLVAALALALPATAAAQQPTCGATITQDTTLTADVHCEELEPGNGLEAGLTLGADGVTLDLGGHELIGAIDDPSVGILNDGYDDVTIRDGGVRGFSDSVMLEGAQRNVVARIQARPWSSGFVLRDSDSNALRHVTVRDVFMMAGFGLHLLRSSDNRIADSHLEGLGQAGRIEHSHLNRIARSEFDAETGLYMDTSHFNRIVDTDLRGVGFGGATVQEGWYNTFARTSFYGGNPFGDFLSLKITGSHNTLQDSTFSGSSLPTFLLAAGTDNLIRRNEFPGLGNDGLVVAAATSDTRVIDNYAHGYSDDGIDVESPSTILRYNQADDNGDHGIEAVPGVTGKGNTATGNGNALQCVNIACN